MSNLKVNIAGVEFKNPIITASGTFGFGREYSEYYDLSVLGGISTKGMTVAERAGNPSPRVTEIKSGMINCVGLQNPGVDYFLKEHLPWLKTIDTRVIANVAGSTIEDYITMCEKVSVDGVDMVELNISCPNVKAGGASLGVDPKNVEAVTRAVRDVCKKPLMVKLTPNVANISENAKGAEAGGADAVSLINTLSGMVVNYKTRKPILSNVHGGISGPCCKPVALKMVWDSYNAVKIPVVGMGGIMNYTDVLEFMICGAAAVQVGAANVFNPMASHDIVKDLERYVKEQDMDINDLVGSLIASRAKTCGHSCG